MDSMKTSRPSLTSARRVALTLAALLFSSVNLAGCAGGRLTLFDPLARSMSRQSAGAANSNVDRNDLDAAERDFKHAIRLDKRNGDAHAGLARVLTRKGDDAAAAKSYRAAVKFAPANPNYAAELGECLARLAIQSLDRRSLSDGSMRAFKLARSLLPADSSLAISHGRWACRLEFYDEALRALQDALQLSPESAEAHQELAKVYDAIGDGLSARRERGTADRLASGFSTPPEQTAAAGDAED